MMNCGKSCIRFILFALNFVIFSLAGTFIGFAIKGQISSREISHFDFAAPSNGTIAAIALGAAIMLISFAGCCGAACNSNCLLYAYSVLIFLMLVGEVAVAAILFHFRGQLGDELQLAMSKVLKQTIEESKGATELTGKLQDFNRIQSVLGCCGVDGFSDWTNTDRYPGADKIPGVCCGKPETSVNVVLGPGSWNEWTVDGNTGPNEAVTSCDPAGKDEDKMVEVGCFAQLRDTIDPLILMAIIIVSIFALLVQILLITFTCCLASAIRADNSRTEY